MRTPARKISTQGPKKIQIYEICRFSREYFLRTRVNRFDDASLKEVTHHTLCMALLYLFCRHVENTSWLVVARSDRKFFKWCFAKKELPQSPLDNRKSCFWEHQPLTMRSWFTKLFCLRIFQKNFPLILIYGHVEFNFYHTSQIFVPHNLEKTWSVIFQKDTFCFKMFLWTLRNWFWKYQPRNFCLTFEKLWIYVIFSKSSRPKMRSWRLGNQFWERQLLFKIFTF